MCRTDRSQQLPGRSRSHFRAALPQHARRLYSSFSVIGVLLFFDSLAAPHGEGDGEASPCAKQFVLNNHWDDRPQTSDLDSLYMPAVCISFVACLLLSCRSSLLADGGRVGGDSA